jgi:hypothetical protein
MFKLHINSLVFSKEFNDHFIWIYLSYDGTITDYFQYFTKERKLKLPGGRSACLNKADYAKVIEKELKLKLKAMFK